MATGSSAFESPTLEHRLAIVEQEVADIKKQIQLQRSQPWYLKHAGKFAGDEGFDEIVRLGREIRVADRLP